MSTLFQSSLSCPGATRTAVFLYLDRRFWNQILIWGQYWGLGEYGLLKQRYLRTTSNSNPREMWTLRHSLHFWHLRTTISTFIITFYYKGNMGQHWQYFQMVHLCLSEVETGGNLSSLRQGEVLSSLEPGRKLQDMEIHFKENIWIQRHENGNTLTNSHIMCGHIGQMAKINTPWSVL